MKTTMNRILAEDVSYSTSEKYPVRNQNVAVIGAPGTGKTQFVQKTALLSEAVNGNRSVVVSDPKGSLAGQFTELFRKNGYQVLQIDFTDLAHSPDSWNPMDEITVDPESGEVNHQDIERISAALIANDCRTDPYWDNAARQFLSILIGFCMKRVIREECNLTACARLLSAMNQNRFDTLMEDYAAIYPDDVLNLRWETVKTVMKADRTWGCICSMLSTHLDIFLNESADRFFSRKERIHLSEIGRQKTALFITVSDSDRSYNRMITLFYTQLFQELIKAANLNMDFRLAVPVHIYMDDFACGGGGCIPDFASIIACIRSRAISCDIVLQTFQQLEDLYGPSAAATILSCCDRHIYLGGMDYKTADEIAVRLNMPPEKVLSLPLNKAVYMERGSKARIVGKSTLKQHPLYGKLLECRTENKAIENERRLV